MNANEYFIITPNFKKSKCQNLLPNSELCGSSERILWLGTSSKRLFAKRTLYVCAECVKRDYKLIGKYSQTWEKEFYENRLSFWPWKAESFLVFVELVIYEIK